MWGRQGKEEGVEKKKKKRGKGKRKETTQKEVKVRIGKAAWSGMHLQ